MYIPGHFREEDPAILTAFLKQFNFATLVTYDGQRPIATHTPMEVVQGEDGSLAVFGHISRANPQKDTLIGQEVLLIFQGAHTYISPRWYNHVNVPTWNYMIAHLYGTAREVSGEELHGLLSRLIQKHEAASTYRLEDLPADLVTKLMNGVFGYVVEVTRLEAGYKLSQNRNDEDYRNIIAQLEKREDDDSRRVAEAMRVKRK